jgi:putative membrane protein
VERPEPTAQGNEPDYRMSLAAERTYLAYLRTGLAITAAGVAVAGALPNADAAPLRRVIGVVLALVGAGVLFISRRRWVEVERAMRAGEPLPTTGLLKSVSWVLVIAALAAAVLVLVV